MHCMRPLKELQSGTQAPGLAMLFSISSFLSQTPPFRSLFIRAFFRDLPRLPLSRSYQGAGGGDTWHFSTLTQYSVLFCSSLLLVPGSIMLQEPFVWNAQRFQSILHICADPPSTGAVSWGKNGRGGWHFSHLTSCLYYKGLTDSFVWACCLNRLLCIWQLSTLSAQLSSWHTWIIESVCQFLQKRPGILIEISLNS